MIVVRENLAPGYLASGHEGVEAWRLQGLEATPVKDFWVGLSVYEPGGIAEWGMGDTEKVYVVLDGELLVTDHEGAKHVLRKHDSCFIDAFEYREVSNTSSAPATLLVIGSAFSHRPPNTAK